MSVESMALVKSAKNLSRNPLGIIALFIVLVYGFACLLFGLSAGQLESSEKLPIIWFVVLFPIVVLTLFGWLVSQHHDKLYAPADYRDDQSFLKTIRQSSADSLDTIKDATDLLDYGGDFEIISEQEEQLKQQLKNRGLPIEGQTIEVLVRQLAASQVIGWFEKTYYNIFGSQIGLMQLASLKDTVEESEAIEIFSRTKAKNPESLGSWDFNQYMNYLVSTQLIDKTNTGYKLGKRGNEFLKMLDKFGYSSEKAL